MRRPAAVFLDKDGTLIEDEPYNVDPSRIQPARGAGRALAALHRAGCRLFVVSNQPGVAAGFFPARALDGVAARLAQLARESGARLEGFYYCPHGPADGCACRKPSPGLIERACLEHGLNAAACWMVGDILDDIEAGHRAGCRAAFIDNGHETEWRRSPWREPDVTAPDLDAAAALILEAGV